MLLGLAFCLRASAQQPSTADAVQQALKDGDSAFAHGSYDIAHQSFLRASQAAESSPDNSPIRYEILKRLTATSVALGQFSQARAYLQSAVKWRESTVGPKDPKILDDLLLSISLDLRTKDFDQALATAQRVQAMHIAAYTADSLPVADDLLRIGEIHLAEGKSQEAVHSLYAAYQLRMKLAGSLDPGLLPILDTLNEAFRKTAGGYGTGTESLYRQALQIRETIYGEDSPEIISALEMLADTYVAGGEYNAAEPLYKRVVSLWEKLVGPDHPMVAVKLDKLADFYFKEGKPQEAKETLARSVEIRARFLALGLAQQAADSMTEGHREQAQVLCNRALVALGPEDSANEDLIKQIRKTLTDIQKPAEK